MYIHRIVIDTNRINARGNLEPMNRLEALHKAGIVEIFQTSTLKPELIPYPQGLEKSKDYIVIGGSTGGFYLPNDNMSYSGPGTTCTHTRLTQIQNIIFGQQKDLIKNDLLDALHIDQANQNDADFFVTYEKKILNAASRLSEAGIRTKICNDKFCETEVREYFELHYGTSDVQRLSARLQEIGPILLGSNGYGEVSFSDNETGEILLAFIRTQTGVAIQAIIRSSQGCDLLTISPNQPFLFHRPGANVSMEVGPSPLLVGNKECRAFSVEVSENTALAGRVLKNGKLLLYKLAIYNTSGKLALQIERGTLMIHNVNLSFS